MLWSTVVACGQHLGSLEQDLIAFGSGLVEVGDRLCESDTAALVPLDPIDDLVESRSLGQPGEFGRQVALKGGAVGSGSLGELAMDFLGDVPYEYVGHAYSMQAPGSLAQPAAGRRAGD